MVGNVYGIVYRKLLKDNDIFFKTIGISNDTLIHNFLPNTVHGIAN